MSIMSRIEKRALYTLSGLYVSRMLGLFMVLPVMAIYGQDLIGQNPMLLGLAIGIYGLSQAILQIPLGMLSDRIGRKPVIVMGLVIFAVGSLVAGFSDHIYGVIIGRTLQGMGAIAASVMALLTDLTREEHRTRAMAFIGMSIGLSFSVAMILGPWLAALGGLSLIFHVTAALAILGIVITIFAIPAAQTQIIHRDQKVMRDQVKKALLHPVLLRLDVSIFILHAVLTGCFTALPSLLLNSGLEADLHGWVYAPVMIVAFILMIPLVIIAEKKHKMKGLQLFCFALLMLSQVLLAFASSSMWMIIFTILLFFVAFNYMEATLPSWLSKMAPAGAKGTAMGLFSTSQFAGAAFGGIFAGWILQNFDVQYLFLALAGLLAVALWVAWLGEKPVAMQNTMFNADINNQHDANAMTKALLEIDGVFDALVVVDEQAVYLKVAKAQVDYEQVHKILLA
jgi:MFS family permease